MATTNVAKSQIDLFEFYKKINYSFFPCRECSLPIWYPHTGVFFNEKTKKLTLVNGTELSNKQIKGKIYQLSICYQCLSKNYPEILHKNSSKLFNTNSHFVKYAFLIDDQSFIEKKKEHGVTLQSLISKYGEIDGISKWKKYCELQRVTNTLEYKFKKYGWDAEQFDKFNKSRAVTEINLQTKYGTDKGLELWTGYVNLQKYTKSRQYYIDKFGEVDGPIIFKEINKKKALTLSTFIRKYGNELGESKFIEYINSVRPSTSRLAQSFFDELFELLKPYNFKLYYCTHLGEFGKLLKTLNTYCKLDFYISDLKLALEYYGNFWHANPTMYNNSTIMYNNLTASQIHIRNQERITALATEHNIDTIIVWEADVTLNKQKQLTNILYEVRKRIRKNTKC